MKVPVVEELSKFPEALRIIEEAAAPPKPAEFPIAMELAPWLEFPAEFPIAMELDPCETDPAETPIAIAKFP